MRCPVYQIISDTGYQSCVIQILIRQGDQKKARYVRASLIYILT